MENKLEKDKMLLTQASDAWQSVELFRRRRRRYKDFAYGRQWSDTIRDTQGRIVSEEQYMLENGRLPITNNLIRQLVKSIVGRYRYITSEGAERGVWSLLKSESQSESRDISEIDARGLEEFLISGSVIQRLGKKGEELPMVENVSPERMFFDRFADTSSGKSRFVGMLHDMPLSAVLRRFSQGDRERYIAIKNLYRGREGRLSSCGSERVVVDFSEPSAAGCCRVIEVWEHLPREIMRCHDYADASYRIEAYSDRLADEIKALNTERRRRQEPEIEYAFDLVDEWQCTWLAPSGEILGRYSSEAGHPFVMKFYPLVDGEVHSLVEDVVDQQKYVNRLISLLDSVIASSAKGVLLYPADQLPEGFTWRDLRRIWSNPVGILPFKRTSKHIIPQQVNSPGASTGASDMLRIQLQLFDEISGTSGAIRGKTSNASGVGMLEAELENGTVSLLDLLASFKAFVEERDDRMNRMTHLKS